MFSFKDNQSVSNLNDVPNEFHPLYVHDEENGVYTLDYNDPKINGAIVALVGSHNVLGNVRSENKQLKTENTRLKNEFTEFKSSQSQQTSSDDIENIKIQWKSESTQNKSTIKALKGQIHQLQVTNKLHEEISAVKGNHDLLMPLLSQSIKSEVDDQGNARVMIVDAHGNQRYSGATASEMTIAELVAETKTNPRFAGAFESVSPSGSGMKTSTGVVTSRPKTINEMSSQELYKAGLAKRGIV